MDEQSETRPGIIARLADDPIRLRRWSWLALLALVLLVVAGQLLSGFSGGMLTALTWICAPFVAFGVGVGDAFFVRHGRGMRRILLSILGSVFTVLTSCVILASISDSSRSWTHDLVVAALYALLYAGIVVGLAGLIALGIGRGEDYVSRRIDRMSREDW
jgi:peptidoglycan/LPS O-acetylase OafA/YrhL